MNFFGENLDLFQSCIKSFFHRAKLSVVLLAGRTFYKIQRSMGTLFGYILLGWILTSWFMFCYQF